MIIDILFMSLTEKLKPRGTPEALPKFEILLSLLVFLMFTLPLIHKLQRGHRHPFNVTR